MLQQPYGNIDSIITPIFQMSIWSLEHINVLPKFTELEERGKMGAQSFWF